MTRHITKACMILSLLSACQTQQLTVSSIPEGVNVEIFDPDKRRFESKGVTPVEITGDQMLPLSIQASNIVAIRLSKPGYIPENVLVDKTSNPKIEIHVNLDAVGVNTAADGSSALPTAVDDLAHKIQSVNSLIAARKYNEASMVVNELTAKFPQVSFFWELKGSIHFLNGEKTMAVSSYSKALELNPASERTKNMLKEMGH